MIWRFIISSVFTTACSARFNSSSEFGKFKSNDKKIEKYQRKIDKLKGKIKNEDSNYDYSIDDVDDGPVIKRVEEDEYVMPKKSRKEKLKELEEAKKRLDKNKPKYRRLSLEDDDEL